MSWTEKMKDWGGANVLFLSEDGECVKFIVVGEPILLKSTFKKKEQQRIGCPIITDEGFTLFVTGKRLARRLSKHEGIFDTDGFIAIRHGIAGDIDSTYELSVLNEPDLVEKLFAIRNKDFNVAMIDEAVEEVKEIMNN